MYYICEIEKKYGFFTVVERVQVYVSGESFHSLYVKKVKDKSKMLQDRLLNNNRPFKNNPLIKRRGI